MTKYASMLDELMKIAQARLALPTMTPPKGLRAPGPNPLMRPAKGSLMGSMYAGMKPPETIGGKSIAGDFTKLDPRSPKFTMQSIA